MPHNSTIPEAPGAWPWLGHAVRLVRSPLPFLRNLPTYGDIVQIRLGTQRVLVVCDPDLVSRLLVHDRTFDKGGPVTDRIREIVADGIGSCPSGPHRRQRRLMQPAFQRSRLPEYGQLMSKQINQVVGRWGDGEILNLRHQMDEMAAAVLLSTLYRTGIDEGRRARIRADLQAIFTGIYWRMMMPTALTRAPTPGNRRYQLARNRLRRLLNQLIEERMSSSTPGDDLIGRLVAARDTEGDGQGLSLQELVDQSLSIYAAGVETMATTLSWACHLLSRNPDMQERLYDEAAAALADRTFTWTDLPDLPYCRQTLMETLRLYPAGWLFSRIATQDTTLGTHPIREGTVLAYSPYLLGHRDSLYPDPERFDPGRWNERLPAGVPRHGFVAFGGGARKCLGDEFAMIEGTLALAAISTRWRLHPQPGTGSRPRVRSTLQPRALRIRVTARDGLEILPRA